MTDSPAVRAPLDPQEQPILDGLLSVRTRLELIKQDKSTYVKSQDVHELYDQVIEQVHRLNEIRHSKKLEQSRVDTVLDDCFQLISLCFLTIGKNNEAPAVYAAMSTIQRLLNHLKEAAFFSSKDLEGIDQRLHDYRVSIERGKVNYDADLLTRLEARIEVCENILSELQAFLSQLSPELTPTYEKLVSILRSLAACNVKSTYPAAEVEDFHRQLKEIEAQLDEKAGKSTSDESAITDKLIEKLQKVTVVDSNAPPSGEKLVRDLLWRNLAWVEIIQQKQGKIDERFQETYNKLLQIRNKLEKLHLTQAWSLRETDLYRYQRQLDRIDEARVDGNFIDEHENPSDLHAQRTMLYLLRKSYALIYHLMISSNPVSEALLPIYNQLLTLKKCLLEVKKHGGVSQPRELYPYSMKLNSLDNMRKDGKFMVGDDIPDGQGAVNELLAECFDICYELRVMAEENSDSEDSGVHMPKETP